MNQEVYTLKRIITALSNEYKNKEILLETLKQNVHISDKNIKNIDFHIIKENNKNPDIGFRITEKNKDIFDFILSRLFNLDFNPKYDGIVLRSNNDFFVETKKFFVNIEDPISFAKKIEVILSSKFINEVATIQETNNSKLNITSEGITLIKRISSKDTLKLVYEAPYNSVKVISDKKRNLSSYELNMLLATAFEKEEFNPYIASIIENLGDSEKKISTVSPSYAKKGFKTKEETFDILETSDEVVFVKKMK